MRQRLGVARCLLADPDLLILDEPTNGLDPGGIQEFRLMVRELVGEGRTVLLSSHLLDEVEKVCDTVAIVDRGRVVAQGSITELSAAGVQAVVFRDIRSGRAVRSLRPPRDPLCGGERHGHPGLARRVSLREARSVAADLNRRVVEGGVEAFEMELPRATLEERFLEITNRMQEEVPA